jgi:hypothetical protein
MRSRRIDTPTTLVLAGMVAMSALLMPSMLRQQVFAATDKFGIDELYSTLDKGPSWFLNDKDPEDDDDFKMTSAEDIKLDDKDSGVYELDAKTGTQKHGVRIHADSPDGEWRNMEMTGYFKLLDGSDQFTLIARQGPTYNDDGGCGAYGYYGLLTADGDAYFKKKLFHHGGYSDRTAVEKNVVDDIDDRWIGLKMAVYDLDNDDVKLELWVDDGDQDNNWKKVTEYVDDGDWETNHSDCDRSSDDKIEEGTRGGFRVDDSEFEFKDLSIREIADPQEALDSDAQGPDNNADDQGAVNGENDEEKLADFLRDNADVQGAVNAEGEAQKLADSLREAF